MIIRIPVHFENANSVSLTVDPLVVASNGDVDRKISAHNEHEESHQDIREVLADKTAQATETKRGTTAIATQAEVNAGKNESKVVVPGRLKSWWDSVRTWGNIKERPATFPPSPHTHSPGQVGLGSLPNAKSDSVSSPSNTCLATSKAVKTAYDKGSVAYSAGTRQASETVRGQAEIATQDEVNKGTDTARFVTPKKLAGLLSSKYLALAGGTMTGLTTFIKGVSINNSPLYSAKSSNSDYLYHDDGTNTWHFVSDSSEQTQATGNSKLQAGELHLGSKASFSPLAT